MIVRAASRLWESDASVVGVTFAVQSALRIVSTIVLTRLLAPDVFGAVGIIMSIAYILNMLSDLGFQSFVVRHAEGRDSRLLDTVWTIRLMRGLALSAAMVASATPIAWLLGKPELTLLIAVSGLIFLVDGLSSMILLTAPRDGMLRRLSALDLAIALLQLVLTIIFAVIVPSYWAIMAALIGSNLIRAALSYTLFPDTKRSLRFDRMISKELWQFSRFIASTSLITLFVSQTDKIVLARLLPLDVFGLYILASSLALAPQGFVTAYGTRILLPEFAKIALERRERLRELSYARRGRITYAYLLGAGLLFGAAPLVVELLYDPRYAPAATYLRWLALAPMMSMSTIAAAELMVVCGALKSLLVANALRLVWLIAVGVPAFLLFGSMGLVATVGTIEVPTLLYSLYQLDRMKLVLWLREGSYAGAALAGVVIGLAVDYGYRVIVVG